MFEEICVWCEGEGSCEGVQGKFKADKALMVNWSTIDIWFGIVDDMVPDF